jgi:flagellar hook-length control protein FliK
MNVNFNFNVISGGNTVESLDELTPVLATTDAYAPDGEAIVQQPLFTEWFDSIGTLDAEEGGACAWPFELESLPAPLGTVPLDASSEVDPQQWITAMIGQHASGLTAVERVDRPIRQALFAEPAGGLREMWDRAPDKVAGAEGPGLHFSVNESPSQDEPVAMRRNDFERLVRESSTGPMERLPIAARVTQAPVVLVQDDTKPQWLKSPEVALSPAGAIAHSTAAIGLILERQVKLVAPEAKWGEQMLAALRDTVQVQVQQRFQHAFIRLDPQELGSLEISVSHESGRLSVQISAAQSDVLRLLQHGSERLRQELGEHNALQVDVQVSGEKQGQRDGQHRDQAFGTPGSCAIAAQVESEKTSSDKTRGSDVLVTV